MNQVIYLDYAAATPMDKRVSEAIYECFNTHSFANASATHILGKMAANLIETNRLHAANLIGTVSAMVCKMELLNALIVFVYYCYYSGDGWQ